MADRMETYAWQHDVPGLGEAGQQRLLNATALVSRVGGLGGPLAFSLAAAGFGDLILAHGGDLRENDLNRQILMSRDHLGHGRAECARETLHRFNPDVAVHPVAANISGDNVDALVSGADIVFSCAPLFEERLAMNRACVEQGKPFVDCAMFAMQGQVLVVEPGETACLACVVPEVPRGWKRRFPVIGALSALVAQIGALEGIKRIAGMPSENRGKLMLVDGDGMRIRHIPVERRAECPVCGNRPA